jgi:hypothetical protein
LISESAPRSLACGVSQSAISSILVPSNHKWVMHAVVADILTSTIHALDLRYPALTDERRTALAAARQQLLSE